MTKTGGLSNRRNAVGENAERMTAWRAGRRERHGFAMESGDRTGMA